MTDLSGPEQRSVESVVWSNQPSVLEPSEKSLQLSQDNPSGLEDTDDGRTLGPPAETLPSHCQVPTWEVDSPCRAVWSEDGLLYPATVVCLDGGRCRVRFTGYDNEEDVELSSLLSPEEAPPTTPPSPQDWRPGSRCRAPYSQDGLIYPAVVLWVRGQRCRVRFHYYNNEEELDVGGLLGPEEAGRGRRKVSGRRRGRREESRADRGGGEGEERTFWQEEQPSLSTLDQNHTTLLSHLLPPPLKAQGKTANQSAAGQDTEMDPRQNQSRRQPTNQSAPLLPTQLSGGESPSIIPPPPPPAPPAPPLLWSADSKECGVSSMLMLWYTCGFHTGTYMTEQRLTSSSKD